MALTDFEKDCINEIFAANTPKDRKRPNDDQQAALDTIKLGTEGERKTLISDYIQSTGLGKVASDIATVDEEIARLTALKADLQAKQTTMLNY